MKPRFKVGQKVRVVSKEKMKKIQRSGSHLVPIIVPSMFDVCSRIVTIRKVHNDEEFRMPYYEIEESIFNFGENLFLSTDESFVTKREKNNM